MQVHLPDPDYATSGQRRSHFRLAALLASSFVAAIWLIHLLNWSLDLGPEPFGIKPRVLAGLPGIVFAPLMHGSFEHLLSNSLPLLVLGTAMLFLYPTSAPRSLPLIYVFPGVAVWLWGRDSVHLGASGLAYGLFGYVLVAGLIRRDRRAIAASLAVSFMYGSMVWGVLPIRHGTSWETHLAGAIVGVVLAIAWRRVDVPPRKRYSWEEQSAGEEADGDAGSQPDGESAGPAARQVQEDASADAVREVRPPADERDRT